MNRRKAKPKLPPLPVWFGPSRVLSDSEVLIHCEHTDFPLHNQVVVLGRAGLLLLTPLPLREGSKVRLEVSSDGQRWEVAATVEHPLQGLGTVFGFLPSNGWAGWLLDLLLTEKGKE